jgi:hypothetical protein
MPPVQVSIQSRLLAEKFAEIANSDPSLLPAIKIGIANQKMYAMNNLNVVQGCKKANPHIEVQVQIVQCSDISDIAIQHMHETINEEPLNPLSVFDIIGILKERGVDTSHIIKTLWLNDTPYEKLFKINESNLISNESIEKLQNIANILETRKILPSLIQIPLYILTKLNRIKSKTHQIILVEKIGAMLSCMTDSKFAWPSPEQIDTMYLYIKQGVQNKNDVDEDKNTNISYETKNDNVEDFSDKSKKCTTEELTNDGESHHDENNHDENSIFPQYIRNHLNPQNKLQIRHRNFDSAEQIQKFIYTLEQQRKNKFTLLWGELTTP